MIEPEDDVTVIPIDVVELRASNADGFVSIIPEDGEGAGGIEANAADGGGIDIVLSQGSLDRRTNATPNVGGRLFLFLVSLSQVCRFPPMACKHT